MESKESSYLRFPLVLSWNMFFLNEVMGNVSCVFRPHRRKSLQKTRLYTFFKKNPPLQLSPMF